MVAGSRTRPTGFLLAVLLIGAPPRAAASGGPRGLPHPLHTTLTEIRWEMSGRVDLELRVFTQDLANAARKRLPALSPAGSPAALSDSAALEYLRSTMTLEAGGARLALRWVGSSQQGEVTLISLTAQAPTGLAALRLGNAVNCDLFEDQVNIVKTTRGGRSESLLFTRGDGLKPLS